MKVSVIVPIYNVEKYLKRCIDSILSQTFTDFELILVDDGSPDKCGEICDVYARGDTRIKVLHLENGGVSNARNKALDVAQGKYITFCDGDDSWKPFLLEKAYNTMEEYGVDCVLYNYEGIQEDGRRIISNHNLGIYQIKEKEKKYNI